MKSSIHLGEHESAVLTNRSKFITIVSDLPYKERCRTNFSSAFSNATGKYLRGSRPMHRTTLCFEEKPFKTDYITTTYKDHSARYNFNRSTPPHRCQSLHHAHFSVGSSKELDLKTQTMKSYSRKELIPASKLHEDQKRWNEQVFAGHLMDKSLRHIGFEKVDHESTYSKVHDALGRSIPRGKPAVQKRTEKYNIISGEYIGSEDERSFRLKSGNKVLQKIREKSDLGIFG